MAVGNPYYRQQYNYGTVGNQSLVTMNAPQPNFSNIPQMQPPQGMQPRNPYFNASNVGTAVGGAIQVAGNAVGMANQRLNLNTQMAPIQQDPNFAPVYTGGALYNQAAGSNPQGASGGEVLSGVATGAAAGAALGPIGAVAGAAIGGIASAIGGGIRRSRQMREKRRALNQARANQQQFNAADQAFRQRSAIMEDYYQQGNNRLYNLYRSQY